MIATAIEGVDYRLSFDFEAIAEAEDLTGLSLLTGLNPKNVTQPTITLVRAMLFACLHAQHPDIPLSKAKTMVNRHNLASIWGAVLEAWTAGMSEPDEDTVLDPDQGQS